MTFLNPLYLFGLLGVSLPVIIHLWYQKRLRRIPFSTLKFLKKSEARRFGWLKFREILILFLRCFFIASIFLALSRPVLKTGYFKFGRLGSVYIIIDNSYSMQYNKNFEQAKDEVRKLLALYSSQSEFCILPLCIDDEDYRVIWQTKEQALSRLKMIGMTYKKGRIRKTLDYFSGLKPHYPAEYFYVGDGQAIVFEGFEKSEVAKNFYWLKIPAGGNIGITKVVLKDAVAIPYKLYKLVTRIENYSPHTWQGVINLISGPLHLQKKCQIGPWSSGDYEFSVPREFTSGKIKIYDDSLPVDNTYYFSKVLPRKFNVLIKGPAAYIRFALESTKERIAPFHITVTKNLAGVDLRKFDFVILNGVFDISDAEAMRLESFLSDKKNGVVCFLGEQVGPGLRNFLARICKVGEEVVPEGYLVLDAVDYEHPIFKIFVGTTSIRNVEFYRFHKIIASSGVVANIAKRYPLIVIKKNLGVVATPFTPRYTNIVYKTSFVPILHRLLLSLTINAQKKEFYIGEEVPEFRVKDTRGEVLNSGERFSVPGFYFCKAQTLAVNVDPEEGNLKSIGELRLKVSGIRQLDLEHQLSGNNLTQLFYYLALFAILFELLLLLIR